MTSFTAASAQTPTAPSPGEVRSSDGTRIGYLRLGTGPGLVFSHGSLTTGEEWLPAAGRLADRFTCFLMSRRGRGRSDPGPSHSLERECEDIAAVLALAGPGTHLLGHSYGAICALETAARTPVAKLVLYEPPLPIDSPTVETAEHFAAYRAAIDAGRLEEALTGACRRLIRMQEPELEELRKPREWNDMVKLAPTWVPEIEAIAALEPGADRYRRVTCPTLLLVGAETQSHHVAASDALQRSLADARTVVLQGQGHWAHVKAPHSVADAVAGFLTPTTAAPVPSTLT